MSQQVQVNVFSGERQVDGPLGRPVRLLPNGRAGVVYGGEVYPLYASDRIDVTDPPHDKVLCTTYVPWGAQIPYTHRLRPSPTTIPSTALLAEDDWHVETNRFGHYLVFDADERTADQVVDVVDDGGLVVRRWDSSHRPADDGRTYDWFVRLGFDGDRDACLRILRGLFRGPAAAETTVAGLPEGLHTSVVAALEKALVVARENTRLSDEVQRLHDELAARASQVETLQLRADSDSAIAATTADVLRGQVAAYERDRARLQETHERQVAVLSSEVAEALELTNEDQAATIAAERDRIFEDYVEADQRLTESLSDIEERDRQIVGLRARVEQLEGRLTEVKDSERERATAARESHQRGRIPRDNASGFIRNVLNRCSLDEDSVELLLDLRRSDKMVRELIRVNDNADDLRTRSKSVQGYAGWFEIPRITIGERKAMGRLYYRRGLDGDVEVHVHDKDDNAEQRRFLERKLS